MMESGMMIQVKMADLQVGRGRGVLRTTGLGSCVGLTLYDSINKTAGMAHIMLPSSSIKSDPDFNHAKYADTAIPMLVNRLVRLGSSVSKMEAKMAGGAQMFNFANSQDTMRIGPRNVESCIRILGQLSIPVKAQDTGGNYGRTIEMNCETGILLIRSVQMGVREL